MNTLLTMADPRWAKLAKIFCKSVRLKHGDRVWLQVIGMDALPFLAATYDQLIKKGAIVEYQISLPALDRIFYRNAQDHQIVHFPQKSLEQMQEMDVYIAARGQTNLLSDAPADLISRRGKVLRPITDERCDNTRWCITYVPTEHDAIMAGMSLDTYTDYFFGACFQDYSVMKKKQKSLVELMMQTDQVSIKAPGTNLTFSIKGIPAISCHGERNIPDGEVYTAPVVESVNGEIEFNVPSVRSGRKWSGIKFIFRNGQIAYADCDQGTEHIDKVLNIDDGARFIGEFAIGTNTGITSPACNTLFDEKIFGSFHFTPGCCYDEASNGNKSTLHWDLVKILTPEYGGGRIEFDGVPVMVDGRFVHPALAGMNP